MGKDEGRVRPLAGEGATADAERADFEDLLSRAIAETLEGRQPDVLALCDGDVGEARRLERALARGLTLAPRSTDEERPERLGPYRIEGEVGQGGMGTVLLGRHEVMGRRVAVKFLPRPFAFIDDYRRRFRREAQVVASLDHPAIVPIHEVGEQDGIPFAAFEYVEGGSLEHVLRELRGLEPSVARERGRDRLAAAGSYERRCAATLASIADALHVTHRAGVVHRDVKPANILLDEDGQARLTDFGLALPGDAGNLTQSGAIVGTRHYLAPELTYAEGRATPSSDVYALGVTLYELLTLRAPFRDEEEEALFRRIREQRPKPPRQRNRHVSRDLEAVCMKALEKRSDRRYETAAQMAEDLRAVVESRPVVARPASMLRRAWAGVRYHRRAVGRWAAVALLIVTVPLTLVEYAERARDSQWNESWSRAQAILVSDLRYQAPWFEGQRFEALAALRRCASLRDDRPRVYVAMAEVLDRLLHAMPRGDPRRHRLRLDRHNAILNAWALGGFNRQLAKIIAHSEWDALADFASFEWLGWSSADCYALAVELYLDGEDKAAYEVLQARSIAEDELIFPELLEAVILGRDALWSEPTLGLERGLGVRFALERFDAFIQEHGADPLVAFRRADLLCNAWLSGFDLKRGKWRASFEEIVELVDELLDDETFNVDVQAASLLSRTRLKALWVLFLASENDHSYIQPAVEELRELEDHQILAEFDLNTYSSAVRCLIVAGEYRRADELVAESPLIHDRSSLASQLISFDGRVTPITEATVSSMSDERLLGLPNAGYVRALDLLWRSGRRSRVEGLLRARPSSVVEEQPRGPSAVEVIEITRAMVLLESVLLSDVAGFREWAEWRTRRWGDFDKECVDYHVRTVEKCSEQIRRGETPTPLDEPTPFERQRQAEAARAAAGAPEQPEDR